MPIETKCPLTHWGRVTHICVGNLTINGPDNGLSPGRRQAIIWTIAGILLIGPLGTNFSEILIGIQTFSFRKMHLKMSSAKWRPSCLGLNVLKQCSLSTFINKPMQCLLNNFITCDIANNSLIDKNVNLTLVYEVLRNKYLQPETFVAQTLLPCPVYSFTKSS